ncbi:MAG: response regulator transcription factor [Gammaproteobacteria bacterium]|nr:response regulator transcription factor [Gammaproteobacteria bacterium]NVK88563.1 response regulator transcription factor [Gammaproteobacteria bacterium]
MNTLKILIADDHPLFRAALIQALGTYSTALEIIEAENHQQTATAMQTPDLDLALVDLNMPGEQGILHLFELCKQHPDVVIVVISGHDDTPTIHKVRQSGAAGFITKSTSMQNLTHAITAIIEQGEYWPESFDSGEDAAEYQTLNAIASMTPQQKRVLAMIADGKLNKQIAYDLNLQETTIKQHVSAILRKLNVYNRTQAGLIYQQATESHAAAISV